MHPNVQAIINEKMARIQAINSHPVMRVELWREVEQLHSDIKVIERKYASYKPQPTTDEMKARAEEIARRSAEHQKRVEDVVDQVCEQLGIAKK